MLRQIQKAGNVVIADGAAISAAIIVPPNYSLVLIEVPTSWTAADMGFAIALDGTTFVDVYTGVGTTVARFRMTGIPTGGASIQLVPGLFEIPVGAEIKLTSINTASNADANQSGDITLGVWIGRTS